MRGLTRDEHWALTKASEPPTDDVEPPASLELAEALVARGLVTHHQNDVCEWWKVTELGRLALRHCTVSGRRR